MYRVIWYALAVVGHACIVEYSLQIYQSLASVDYNIPVFEQDQAFTDNALPSFLIKKAGNK